MAKAAYECQAGDAAMLEYWGNYELNFGVKGYELVLYLELIRGISLV